MISGPRCGRLMRRYEKAGEPYRDTPRCGRREGHKGDCRSEAAVERDRMRNRDRREDARREKYRVLREAGVSAAEANRLKNRAAVPDVLLRKAHARAVALRSAGLPVTGWARMLDAEYHQRSRRLRGADSGGRYAGVRDAAA